MWGVRKRCAAASSSLFGVGSAIAQAMTCQFAIFKNNQLIKLFKTKTVNPGKEGKRISFVKKKDAPP
jgi:hypothetical protein